MNKSVTKYIFPYSSFHAEHDGDIYFHLHQFFMKVRGFLQPHVSLFIPPLSCTIVIHSVLRSKTEYKKKIIKHKPSFYIVYIKQHRLTACNISMRIESLSSGPCRHFSFKLLCDVVHFRSCLHTRGYWFLSWLFQRNIKTIIA